MTGVTSITDLHLRKANTKTEPNLLATQEKLMKNISEICYSNSLKYDKHIIIFYGDICDRQLSEMTFVQVCFWLKELSLHSKLYIMRGNHETTYKGKFNVFWHVSYGMAVERTNNFLHVADLMEFANEFDVDGTRFILNHNNTKISYEDSSDIKNIVIATHNAVILPELQEMLEEDEMQDPKSNYVKYSGFSELLPTTNKVRYVLAGHLHSLYGQYRIEEGFNGVRHDFIMYFLSSLGRPKSNEITSNNQRDLPTFEIDGDNLKLVHNYIQLDGREILDEEEVLMRQDKYEKSKHIKYFKKQTFSREDILSDIKRLYSMDMQKNYMLENALEERADSEIDLAVDKINSIAIYE